MARYQNTVAYLDDEPEPIAPTTLPKLRTVPTYSVYQWRGDWRPTRPLRPDQLAAVARTFDLHGYCAGYGELRTGKTSTMLVVIAEADVKRTLVVCQTTPMAVWQEQAEILGCPFTVEVLDQTTIEARAARLQHLISTGFEGVIVVNLEATIEVKHSRWVFDPRTHRQRRQTATDPRLSRLIPEWQPDFLIYDECQRLKNHASGQSRQAARFALLPSVRGCVGLSGTPITNGIEDLFGQFLFINPSVYGRSWSAFETRYLKIGGFDGQQIVGYKNEQYARRLMEENAWFLYQDDAFEVFEPIDETIKVPLTDESAARYLQFHEDAVATIPGVDEEGRKLSRKVAASLRIVQLRKLHELAGGHIKTRDDADRNITLDVSSEKIDVAVDRAGQAIDAGEAVVIGCYYRREVTRLRALLEARYPGQVGLLIGGMSIRRKNAMKVSFQRGILRALVCQIRVASLGIDLTAARTVILVSTGYSFEDFSQFHDRTVGPNQTGPCTYYYLQAVLPDGKPTVDQTIYHALREHQNIARLMVNMRYAQRMFA